MLLKKFDRDGNGQLDIEEFAGFYAETKAMLVPSQFSREAYIAPAIGASSIKYGEDKNSKRRSILE